MRFDQEREILELDSGDEVEALMSACQPAKRRWRNSGERRIAAIALQQKAAQVYRVRDPETDARQLLLTANDTAFAIELAGEYSAKHAHPAEDMPPNVHSAIIAISGLATSRNAK